MTKFLLWCLLLVLCWPLALLALVLYPLVWLLLLPFRLLGIAVEGVFAMLRSLLLRSSQRGNTLSDHLAPAQKTPPHRTAQGRRQSATTRGMAGICQHTAPCAHRGQGVPPPTTCTDVWCRCVRRPLEENTDV